MTFIWKVFFFSLLAGTLAFVPWVLFHKKPVPRSENDVINRVFVLMQDGRYDDADSTIQMWLKGCDCEDASGVELYRTRAMIYIVKAHKKHGSKDESIRQAEENLNKSLLIYDANPPKELDVELFEIGGAFDILGDLSDTRKCEFYLQARQAFVRQLPMIVGDTSTAYGKTIHLERVRAEIRRHLEKTNEKIAKAGCKVN